MQTAAYFSPNRTYRYWLQRSWEPGLPVLAVIGLNPSTADEVADDPTIRKVIGFAERLECGGILMLNLGAYRATKPAVWRTALDPIGPENRVDDLQRYLYGRNVLYTVAAWGSNGRYALAQCKAVREGIQDLWCWGTTSDGWPRHPLMLPYSTKLLKWEHEA